MESKKCLCCGQECDSEGEDDFLCNACLNKFFEIHTRQVFFCKKCKQAMALCENLKDKLKQGLNIQVIQPDTYFLAIASCCPKCMSEFEEQKVRVYYLATLPSS